MLIRFTVKNFLSIRDAQTVDFAAVKTCKERLEENTFEVGGVRLLKTVALYGANASGKTNFMKAFHFFKDFLGQPQPIDPDIQIGFVPFMLCYETIQQPALFEIEFLAASNHYRYGFEIINTAVIREWLFSKQEEGGKDIPLFLRERSGETDKIEISDHLKSARGLEQRTRSNTLFLKVCMEFAVKEVEDVRHGIFNINGLEASPKSHDYSAQLLFTGELKDEIESFLLSLDTQIRRLEVSETPKDVGRGQVYPRPYQVAVSHNAYDLEGRKAERTALWSLGFESAGTQKLFALAGPLQDALAKGKMLYVDELDAQLHPLLTRHIIKLFNQKETNPRNAQLFFNTHDSNLLGAKIYNSETKKYEHLLRRDQIYFAEKDAAEGTHIYSLIEFKDDEGRAIRNDASFEKDYLEGRYGAIPFIGELPRTQEEK